MACSSLGTRRHTKHVRSVQLNSLLASITTSLTALWYSHSIMAWRCSGRTNADLIANMHAARIITSDRVKEVSSNNRTSDELNHNGRRP
jgi:hypothetical protein